MADLHAMTTRMTRIGSRPWAETKPAVAADWTVQRWCAARCMPSWRRTRGVDTLLAAGPDRAAAFAAPQLGAAMRAIGLLS